MPFTIDYNRRKSSVENLMVFMPALQAALLSGETNTHPLPMGEIIDFLTSRKTALQKQYADIPNIQIGSYIVDLRKLHDMVVYADGFEAMGYGKDTFNLQLITTMMVPDHAPEVHRLAMAAIDIIRNLSSVSHKEYFQLSYDVVDAAGKVWRMQRYNYYLGYKNTIPRGVYATVCVLEPIANQASALSVPVKYFFNCQGVKRAEILLYLTHYGIASDDDNTLNTPKNIPDKLTPADIELLRLLAKYGKVPEVAKDASIPTLYEQEYKDRKLTPQQKGKDPIVQFITSRLETICAWFGAKNNTNLVAIATLNGLIRVKDV